MPTTRSPQTSPTRKRFFQSDGSPLKIQIPKWNSHPAIHKSTPVLAPSSESESEGAVEPATPRNGAVSPRASATIVTLSSPATSDGVANFQLGSLCISDGDDLPGAKPSPIAAPRRQLGPLVFLKPLSKSSYGRPYTARDKCTSCLVCAKVFRKKKVQEDKGIELLCNMLAELRAYRCISRAEDCARDWLMEAHGVVQDASRIIFVMVCLIFVSSIWHLHISTVIRRT